MTINLFDPGMTYLHKAGLAGLWMTLDALKKEEGMAGFASGSGSWECTPTSVTLRWSGQPSHFFDELIKRSFKLTDNPEGLLWFPGIGEPIQNLEHAVILHEAVLGSFLQHGLNREAGKANSPGGACSIEIDGNQLLLRFRRVFGYAHQKQKFNPNRDEDLACWLFPGGAVRHADLGNSTALREPPGRALVLRYAPVGAIFFEIARLGGGVKPSYALVIPEILDLENYARARRDLGNWGTEQLKVAGVAEAGYRVLVKLEAAGLLVIIDSAFCRVISFGIVPWSKQQKTRVHLMTVEARSEAALRTYERCRQVLTGRLIKPKDGDPFWAIPHVPDLVATNLSKGRKWWLGFADFIADKERGDSIFRYEKGGLSEMVDDESVFPEGPERTFVLACHEAWRRRLGQLGQKAKREGSSFAALAKREFEHFRVTFSRCKNAASIREAVTDFWARGGGGLKHLQDGWRDVLSLFDDKNWRKAKDLALLALVSYKSASKEEADALESSGEIEEEGG